MNKLPEKFIEGRLLLIGAAIANRKLLQDEMFSRTIVEQIGCNVASRTDEENIKNTNSLLTNVIVNNTEYLERYGIYIPQDEHSITGANNVN